MSILKLINFPRKASKEITHEVRTMVVISNLVDHASFLASVLYTLAKRELSNIVVQLVDIRENIPGDADAYLWLDAGTEKGFKGYCQDIVSAGVRSSEARGWYCHIMERSTFLQAVDSEDRTPEASIIGLAYAKLQQEHEDASRYRSVFMRHAVVSEVFLTDQLVTEDCCAYYDALKIAYRVHVGELVEFDDFLDALYSTQERVIAFTHEQKQFSRVISQKFRELIVGGSATHYLTSVGPDIWNMLRRITLSKKQFVHASMGSYGIVMYSTSPLPAEFSLQKGTMLLAPDHEPVRKYN